MKALEANTKMNAVIQQQIIDLTLVYDRILIATGRGDSSIDISFGQCGVTIGNATAIAEKLKKEDGYEAYRTTVNTLRIKWDDSVVKGKKKR